ncbi:MAG: hypothetical protein Q4E41_10100 [Bacteroidales bacterium]|nr:hypothetical protein [Bacteroidales bacterium]
MNYNVQQNPDFPTDKIGCKITIEYDGTIRCIDLEKLLSGIRLIYQHELAKRIGGKSRDYTESTQIQSIEKGSININLIFDITELNIDLADAAQNPNASRAIPIALDIIQIIADCLTSEEVADNLRTAVGGIKAAIKHFNSMKIQSGTDAERIFKSDKSGNIRDISKIKNKK